MDLSFSELKDLVFNASLGSNLPTGIGKDLSLAVTFLEARSLPGGKEFLNALKCQRRPPTSPQKKGLSFIFSDARVIFEGVTAIDFLVSEVCESVILKNIDSSTLLFGLASNYRGFGFSFFKNKEIYASILNDDLCLRHKHLKYGNDIEICLNHRQLDIPLARSARMSLDESTFRELINLASNMLVPESELSRERGAGAGNIDND